MLYHLFALLVSLLIGLLLPHPFGLILVGAIALGGLWRLDDRVSRLEAIVEYRLGIRPEEDPYRSADAYEAERARIRARVARYAEEAKEEKQ